MLRDYLHNKKEGIEQLARLYGAKNVKVFGSVARGSDTPKSDIDLLVSFDSGYDMFKQRIPLQQALSQLLNRKVDLVVAHELNKHIKSEILESAKDL